MKNILLLSALAIFTVSMSMAQTEDVTISSMEESINILQLKQEEMEKRLQQLSEALRKDKKEIQQMERENMNFHLSIDSLKVISENLERKQEVDGRKIKSKLQDTDNRVATNQSALKSRTLWGGIIIAVVIFLIVATSYYQTKQIKSDISSINEVRKAQEALQSVQTRMQEESVKLDNKLLELAEKQMGTIQVATTNTTPDHSLTLKVADELVRIEMNLSRMDSSIKGYKQLVKAVQRIKDNFSANGYEIVDMLGKPYNAGMKAAVTFVTDENLEMGQQIITKIIKPQINYRQQMIQAAQIEVSQPE